MWLNNNGNEGVLYISQISKFGALPSDSLTSSLGHQLVVVGGSYSSAEMQLIYSIGLANWAYFPKGISLMTGVHSAAMKHISYYALEKIISPYLIV